LGTLIFHYFTIFCYSLITFLGFSVIVAKNQVPNIPDDCEVTVEAGKGLSLHLRLLVTVLHWIIAFLGISTLNGAHHANA